METRYRSLPRLYLRLLMATLLLVSTGRVIIEQCFCYSTYLARLGRTRAVVAMMQGPERVPLEARELSGFCMTLSLQTGILSGSAVALSFASL